MKRKLILLASMALFLTGCGQKMITVAGIQSEEEGEQTQYIEMKEFELKEPEAQANGEEADYCVVMIPLGYHESEEIPGMYVHERNPLDSSNVYYTVSEGLGGKVSHSLTEKEYKEIVENAYREAGEDVELAIESFEEIDMEGIPGYKIRSVCQIGEEEMEQLAYLILAENTYTVTYSQMADDELMADFEISDGEIRLVREDEVSLAKSEDEEN